MSSDMMKLASMSKEQLEKYVDSGQYCDQDIIDLYDDLKEIQGLLDKCRSGDAWTVENVHQEVKQPCKHERTFSYNHGYHTICTDCGEEI